jgi:hypothetical protein
VFRKAGAAAIRAYGSEQSVFFDLKSVFDRTESDLRI